jgi:phage shock protein E
MNVTRHVFLILLLGFALPCFAEPPDLSLRQSLSPLEAAALQHEKLIYLDVRTSREWLAGHVEGAVHIPYDEVARRIATVLPDRSVPIITYCASGGRAAYVVNAMRKQGYTVVPVTNGGFRELIANGMKKN